MTFRYCDSLFSESTRYALVRIFNYGCTLIAFSLVASICSAQTADFTASTTSGCFPLTVNFTDASTGSPTLWSWSFGNSNSSTLQNPSAIYSQPGVYNVTLTLPGNGSTKTKTGFITVYDKPGINFTSDVTSGCSPVTVKFTDQSTPGSGVNVDWLWVFGDGGSSTAQNPQYTYTSSGTMVVSLRVKNQFGCENTGLGGNQPIIISGPLSDFQPKNISVCQVPATIQFTDKSTGTGTLSYHWNFGDGKTSQLANPSNTYTQAGSYTATLETTDANGCKSISSGTINAGSQAGLDFSTSALRVCAGQEISFTTVALSSFTNLAWNFGNQATSTQTNPSYTYPNAGTYQVTLEALLQGNTCISTVTKTVVVFAKPVPAFTYTAGCNFRATFNNTSTNATNWSWDFGNGGGSNLKSPQYFFTGSGDFPVTLTAYTDLACVEKLETVIHIPDQPKASFQPTEDQDCFQPSLSGCAPFTVTFLNTSDSESDFTSNWIFGDGATSNDKNPQPHIYINPGVFTVSLKITNTLGCTNTTTAKVTVSNTTPVAKFRVDKTEVCSRQEVEFIDESTNADFWCWDFGDSTKGSGKTTKHTYEKPGTYTAKLTAKNAGCTNTFEIINTVTVKNPFVEFEYKKNCTDPNTITLQNNSTGFHSMEWNFGDGQTSTTAVSSHTFATTGNYLVSLKATNNDTQCTVIHSLPVNIYNVKADFKIDNTKPCKYAPVNFTDMSTSASGWQWTFGNQNSSTLQNPKTSYDNPGTYDVTLRASDPDGCSKEKTISLNVINLQGNFNTTISSICTEFYVQFNDNSSGTPPITGWNWDFGDGQTSPDKNPPTHTYTKTGSYPIIYSLTNAEGTCSFIDYDNVVLTIPNIKIKPDKPEHCMNEAIDISNQTTNASFFKWNFGNGQTSPAANPPKVSYDTKKTYKITLEATDDYGCTIEDSTFVTITKPEALFSAGQTSSPCPPLSTRFTIETTGSIQNAFWDFGDGHTSTIKDLPFNTYVDPGSYDVTLIVQDNNNCSDTIRREKLVNVGGPSGDFSLGDHQAYCTNDSIVFGGNTQNTAVHLWDFGDGNVDELASASVKHLYWEPGSFTVTLVLIDSLGCKINAKGNVQMTVQEPTLVSFLPPPCMFKNDPLILMAGSADPGLIFSWEIDGVAVSTDAVLQVPTDMPGTKEISLHTINQSGCTSDTTLLVRVNGYVEEIPNVFTPNDRDTLNSYFEVKGVEYSEWNLYIFNRWGHTVYKSKNYTNNWNGGDLPTGVYYYYLENALCPDKKYKGPVSILR